MLCQSSTAHSSSRSLRAWQVTVSVVGTFSSLTKRSLGTPDACNPDATVSARCWLLGMSSSLVRDGLFRQPQLQTCPAAALALKAITLTSVHGQCLPAHCQITEPFTDSTVVFPVDCQPACPPAFAGAELGSIEGQLCSPSLSFQASGAAKYRQEACAQNGFGQPWDIQLSSHTHLIAADKLDSRVSTIHLA